MDQSFVEKEHEKALKKVKEALQSLGDVAIEIDALGVDKELVELLENIYHAGIPLVSRREMKKEEREKQIEDIKVFQKAGSL